MRFEFESGIVSFYFSFTFVSFRESRLLVSRYAGGRCGMVCSDENHGRSRRPGAEDQGWSHRSGTRWPGDREVGWRHVRSAPCTWRRGARFLGSASKPRSTVWPQNHLDGFSSVWASKLMAMISSSLASKPAVTVFSSLSSKLVATVSPGLASKPAVGFLVEPQNQGGGGFPGLDLKIGSFSLVIWASKSPRLFLGLGLKTKWASVCRLHHKTDGGWSAWDTRRDLAVCFTWKQVWLGFPSLA
jgi:hypothetical protein